MLGMLDALCGSFLAEEEKYNRTWKKLKESYHGITLVLNQYIELPE